MGNVMAASQAPGGGLSPPGSMPPPPPPTVGFPQNFVKTEGSGTKTPAAGDSVSSQINQQNGLENPGSMEDLHKKCKDVFPVIFEGAKLMINKGLSNHFQVSHTINMGSVTPSGYRFAATYVGTKQISPSEAFPVLLGDIDPSGNLNAHIVHQIGQRVKVKFAAQIQNSKFQATQLTTEYKGNDFTASCTAGNTDIINESGLLVTHYLQSVTPNVALGAELVYQYGPSVPSGEIAILSAAARYTGTDSVVSGTLGGAGLHLCYYQKASEQLQLGVELETNFRMQESVASVGYQVDLPKADLVFRGTVDSNWTVGAVLEKRLQPLPFNFALSGTLNHSKNQFRLGCGLIIG
ncbi:mitochondrial import receptor subunit TOM40 homolog 1 [Periplaneta americana]|uniref:mitochondrial import receptor subunit TOM40 homolog 1 n=1 Tax=Periplaneta americana TaxID=6978 RepID=UPI0037E6FB89